jgi:hypothetical protein
MRENIQVKRIRWVHDGEVIEQDGVLLTTEEWLALKPTLPGWKSFGFGSHIFAISFPLGLEVEHLSRHGV